MAEGRLLPRRGREQQGLETRLVVESEWNAREHKIYAYDLGASRMACRVRYLQYPTIQGTGV